MNQVSNQSVAVLMNNLLAQLQENGFAVSAIERANRYARHLSNFMEQNDIQTFDKSVGLSFLNDIYQHRTIQMQKNLTLFVARINAVVQGDCFVTHVKMTRPAELPEGLECLLTCYKEHSLEMGLHLSTILNYESRCRVFLKSMANAGASNSSNITVASVSRACLCQPNSSDYPSIRTFLRFLFEYQYLERDLSSTIPYFKPPQPMPSVYSIKEVRRIEETADQNTAFKKRNFAMFLLATRLGIRAGDIVTITFDELNFKLRSIRIIQNKTGVPLELPMLPAISDALTDYIQDYRGNSSSQYVFLSLHPPFSTITATAFGRYLRLTMKDAGIIPGYRRSGPHAMRSSLASSMINDGIRYEVVKRTLGHTGINAIKSYAKLDVEQLKQYTLEPPIATGHFADILAGRRFVK